MGDLMAQGADVAPGLGVCCLRCEAPPRQNRHNRTSHRRLLLWLLSRRSRVVHIVSHIVQLAAAFSFR